MRSSFYGYVKRKEVQSLKEAVQQHIDDLKRYKFKSQRISPFIPELEASYANRKDYEITIDRIFKWILKMRKRRIDFYERVLQEYKNRKDKYDQQLRKYLENKGNSSSKRLSEFSIDSVLSDLRIKFAESNLLENYYEISNQSWYLRDLLKLENPEIERYQGLPLYRAGGLHAHPEGLKAFFELFSIFRDEMGFILPDEPDKSFFERVLTVLKRDFIDDFEQRGDLEEVIVEFIEELEKFEFLSLPKEQFFNKLSKTIYNLRARRIAFYEAMLEDYLANKEKYDNVI